MGILEQAMESSKVVTKQINGNEYTITKIGAKTGLRIKELLLRSFAPAIGVFVDGLKKGDDLLPEEQTFFTDIAIALVANMSELRLVDTVDKLLENVYCNGELVVFDTHFAGNYGELYLVIEFVLRENYGDFFPVFLKAKGIEIPTLGAMMAVMNQMGQKPEESEKT